MQDELRKAGNNLASGNLPLKQELTDQLRGIESASDKQLSQKQLQELQDRLQKGKLAAQTAPKSNGKLSDEMQKALVEAGMGHMQGPAKGEGGSRWSRAEGNLLRRWNCSSATRSRRRAR